MKKLIINEAQKNMIIEKCLCGKHYTINPEKVLVVKKFLDNNFDRADFEDTDDFGLPCVTQIVVTKSLNGDSGRNMFKEELKDLLVEKFKNMFTDEDEKMKFLGQVMEDWYNNKIGLYGSLSVNHL